MAVSKRSPLEAAPGVGPLEESKPAVKGDRTHLRFDPLRDEHMPGDFRISLEAYRRGGTDGFLERDPKHGPKHVEAQPMRGFEPHYREHHRLHRPHHPPNLGREGHPATSTTPTATTGRVWDDVGLQYGREKIVADTVHTNNAMPDIRLVRRRGDLGRRRGRELPYLAPHHDPRHQHRLQPVRTADRPAGAAALRRQLRIARQRDLRRARRLRLGRDDRAARPRRAGDRPAHRVRARVRPLRAELRGGGAAALARPGEAGPASHPGSRRRRPGVRPRRLPTRSGTGATSARWTGSTPLRSSSRARPGASIAGVGQIRSHVLSMVAMFPNIALGIEDLYWMGNARDGYLVSIRWGGVGAHRGHGPYGDPTGRECHLWGITQWLIENGPGPEGVDRVQRVRDPDAASRVARPRLGPTGHG